MGWSPAELPRTPGLVAAVTGANAGLGFEVARVLSSKGARVLLLCRDPARGEAAASSIRGGDATAEVEVVPTDLADLDSVRAAAEALHDRVDRLDLLINNAGVMAPPAGQHPSGIELQLATNHLGHFALTGQVLDLLSGAPAGRVVTVSSLLHRRHRLDPTRLDEPEGLRPMAGYARSKLCNLLFALELDRRLRRSGSAVRSVAAHPGWTQSHLLAAGPLQRWPKAAASLDAVAGHLGQPTHMGALPLLFAALDPSVRGGDYVGPGGPFELFGAPQLVEVSAAAADPEVASALWAWSETTSAVSYGVG